MTEKEPKILSSALVAHDPDAMLDPANYPTCPRCGKQSLAAMVDHICEGCVDTYVYCVRCANPEHYGAEPTEVQHIDISTAIGAKTMPDTDSDRHADTVRATLAEVEAYVRAGKPFGCGNKRCPKGCDMEYENVPNPHVYRSFYLAFEHDDEKGWQWVVEGCGMIATGSDPIALIEMASRFPARRVPGQGAQIDG